MGRTHVSFEQFLQLGEAPDSESPLGLRFRAQKALASTWNDETLNDAFEIALEVGAEDPVEVPVGYRGTELVRVEGPEVPLRTLECYCRWLDSDNLALVGVRDVRFDESQLVWAVLVLDPGFAEGVRKSVGVHLSLVPKGYAWPSGYQVLHLDVGPLPSNEELQPVFITTIARQMAAVNRALLLHVGRAIAEGAAPDDPNR